MTCLHCPDGEPPLPLHVPPLPGLAGNVEGDGAGVLAQVADLPLLLRETQNVFRVENGLLAQSTDLRGVRIQNYKFAVMFYLL